MMTWETFEHQADIGVRGFGDTLEEAFSGAATALIATMCDPATIVTTQSVEIDCDAPDLEILLVDWLNALVYQMAVNHLIFKHFDINIKDHQLHAQASGEPVSFLRHKPAVEIKGATFTELKVRRQPHGRWLAQCVIDV